MRETPTPKVGQMWRAVRATAEDVNHLDYTVETVEAVEGGAAILRRADGRRTRLSFFEMRLYLDLVEVPGVPERSTT